MPTLREQTIDAMRDIKGYLRVGDWGFDSKDAGKLIVKLDEQGDVQEIIKHVFLSIVRSKEIAYCTSLKKLMSGKKDTSDAERLEFSIPLPVRLENEDKVRFFCLGGGTKIRQFTFYSLEHQPFNTG